MFLVVGNYLPKCKQTYTVGIRLPWTLADEDNWPIPIGWRARSGPSAAW